MHHSSVCDTERLPTDDTSPWLQALKALLSLAFVHALAILLLGLDRPLLDMQDFRQTQTAVSAYWILKGGPWVAYETPVLGYPWSVPFEFPLYQLIVAGVAGLGVPLDIAGRIVGFCFFLGGLWPLRMLFRATGLSKANWYMTATLYLTAPLYLFWSRTFLIESCALFFSLLWLALTALYLKRPKGTTVVVALIAGCLAILTKSTTFPAFALTGGLLTLLKLRQARSEGQPLAELVRTLAIMTTILLFPFFIGILWVWYSDHIKEANSFGKMLTSDAIVGWNFGTLSQKIGRALWIDTVRDRTIPDTLGRFAVVGFIALIATLTDKRSFIAASIALIAFLTPFVVFTNLHIVHNYYQNANAIFLLAAIGIGVGCIFDSSHRFIAIIILVAIAAGQLLFFYGYFAPLLTSDPTQNRFLQIGNLAHDKTNDGESLIVIGNDWSSAVPYVARRKSLALPGWTPRPILTKVFDDPQSFLGTSKLGGIVYCTDKLSMYSDRAPLVESFVAGRKRLAEAGGCELLSPDR